MKTFSNILVEDAHVGTNSSGTVPGQTGVRLLKIKDFYQSAVRLIDGKPNPLAAPVFRYVRCLDLLITYRPDAKKYLYLGMGGGVNASRAEAAMQGSEVHAVEISPEVASIAVESFGLDPDKVHIHVQDAESWLESSDIKFDCICVDIFGDEESTTPSEEFLTLLSGSLVDDGVIAVNMIGPLAGEGSAASWDFISGYKKLFANVDVYPVSNEIGPVDLTEPLLNYELFVSDGTLEIERSLLIDHATDPTLRRIFRDKWR